MISQTKDLFAHIARMVSQNLTSQVIFVQMHIYLRSFDAFMPQHLLDGPQIRSALQQVCGNE